MAGPPKFQLKSTKWNVACAVGVVVLAVVGYGSLFFIQDSLKPTGTPVTWLLVILGIVAFLLFALPGIVYSLRKRNPPVKKVLPGGTMAWIRSHLYLPILAVAAAFVHATVAPFRDTLSSGKVLLAIGVLICISGVLRHHMIGVQKEALNLNLAITKLTFGEPRAFRNLVTDLVEDRRPMDQLEADAATLDAEKQEKWQEAKALAAQIDEHFPRSGGQRPHVRHYKLWKAVHPPLTILFFCLLAFHIWDVLAGSDAFFGDEKRDFASAQSCAGCHSDLFQEWSLSAMAHAQTSTIMRAQLPVTVEENIELAEQRGQAQKTLLESSIPACVNCHAPVGSRFTDQRVEVLLPLGAPGSAGGGSEEVAIQGGNEAVHEDGVGCISCHTQAAPLPERTGFAPLPVDPGGADDYGTQFGPLFTDPPPLPVRVHGMGGSDDPFWNDPEVTSRMCGECHNVKVDLDGDGLDPRRLPEDDFEDRQDSDGDFQLDQNELDRNAAGGLDDLVLQTTFDEWQDYVAGFDRTLAQEPDQALSTPLGCVECHMPTSGNGEQKAVDSGPGVNPVPERPHRSHTFVGVDYDLDPKQYEKPGMPADGLDEVLAERKALLESAVTLEVVNGQVTNGVLSAGVVVRNNRLGHAFPTGFAFARQFWLEVSARTTSGRPVCLRGLFPGLPSPCVSGTIASPADDLRQCNPLDIARVGNFDPVTIGNSDIKFATSFPAGDCDPWLANFQKILTDGDANGDGVFEEVPYQLLLPDVVKLRTRVADQQVMAPLESVRTDPDDDGEQADLDSKTLQYQFDVAGVPPGEQVVVTAKMRFRHLPPDFVRGLAVNQEEIPVMPEDARIDPDELLENMVVTDVVEAKSGQGPVLACKGPQNELGASVLDCIPEEAPPAQEGRRSAGLPFGIEPRRLEGWFAWSMAFLAVGVVFEAGRRRVSRAHSEPLLFGPSRHW